jgi:putative ABC transport system ATP-binding protein
MNNIIEAHSVSKIYQAGSNSVKAVDKVSFTVKAGEFIGLVGPSGSGKTTLLAMLAALLSPTEGNVTINGVDLGSLGDKERVEFRRQQIGFTFQSNNLLPYLTVSENIELMLRLNGRLTPADNLHVSDLINRLGLGPRLNSLPNQLSGGERQRVAIARSIIHNPSVVLADEPTASLDTNRAYQVVEQYAALIHEQNKAGIMVTHDLRMCKYVDKIIQIKDGNIVSVIEGAEEINALISCG